MNRRAYIVAGSITAVLVVAGTAMWLTQRRMEDRKRTPDWTNPHQAPESISPDLLTVSDAATWATYGVPGMADCCPSRNPETRPLRYYCDTLANAPWSLIRERC